jgi:large subunit ribosomal protein L25
MADDTQGTELRAEPRTEFGKGAARRIRRDHKIPAVVYGHGEAPRHVSLPGHATMMALKQSNALLSLDMGTGERVLTIAKDVQVEPVKREIEHVDLVIVRSGERIEVSVPVHLEGEAAGGTIVTLEQNTLTITAEATHLPDSITVDVTDLPAGTHITAAQLRLPRGTEVSGDPEATVVAVLAAPTADEVEADLEASEGELGIERDEKVSEDLTGGSDSPEAEAAAAPAGS